MSTRNERSRKRKADEISDEEPDHIMAPPPHLPASCLGAILNLLPYSDVRTCMLAGSAMAVGAVRHVDVLSIDKAAGMDVPALRRFPSVTILKVLCLVEADGALHTHKLNAGVAAKIVPLITSLSALREVWLGGHESGKYEGFFMYRHHDDDDENDVLSEAERDDRHLVFRTLVEALGAAYASRAISQNLKIVGIDLATQVRCGGTEGQQMCRTCSHFCRNFPLNHVLELGCASGWVGAQLGDICVDREEICKIIKSRPGGNDAITSKRAGLLMLVMLSEFVGIYDLRDFGKVKVFYFVGYTILVNMVSWGYDFSAITYSDVVRLIPHLSKPKEIRIQEEGSKLVQTHHTLKNMWRYRNEIERLVKLGLPIQADWFEYESVE